MLVDREGVVTGLVTAAVLAVASVFVSSVLNGKIVSLMGGLTQENLASALANLPAASPMDVKVVVKRIGPKGVEGKNIAEGEVENPDYYVNTLGAGTKDGFIPIGRSEGQQICTISHLLADEEQGKTGSCEIFKDDKGWKIEASGMLECRVSCFKLTTSR